MMVKLKAIFFTFIMILPFTYLSFERNAIAYHFLELVEQTCHDVADVAMDCLINNDCDDYQKDYHQNPKN